MSSARQTSCLCTLGFLLGKACHCCTVYMMGYTGFAANMRSLLQIYPLLADNGTFFVDSTHMPYKCGKIGEVAGGIHDFFDSPDLVDWSPEAEAASGDSPCQYITPSSGYPTFISNTQLRLDDLEADAMRKLWHYSPQVRRYTAPAIAQLAAVSKPTIAFHIRGGDKLQEDTRAERSTTWAHDYVNAFLDTHPHVKGGTCIMAGDDAAFLQEAVELAQSALNCTLFALNTKAPETGHVQAEFIGASHSARCEGTLRLLSDLELMANADYFVGTFNSGMAFLVDRMRHTLYDKDRATFTDASLGHFDWYNNVRGYLREDAARRGAPQGPGQRVDPLQGDAERKEAIERRRNHTDTVTSMVYERMNDERAAATEAHIAVEVSSAAAAAAASAAATQETDEREEPVTDDSTSDGEAGASQERPDRFPPIPSRGDFSQGEHVSTARASHAAEGPHSRVMGPAMDQNSNFFQKSPEGPLKGALEEQDGGGTGNSHHVQRSRQDSKHDRRSATRHDHDVRKHSNRAAAR